MKTISEILPQIQISQNSAPAKQEQKPLKTSEFQIALSGKRIVHLIEIEPLKQALRYIIMLVGLRAGNMPSDEEKMVLINHILKNYSGHTCEEIKLAFEMAIAGKLDLEQSEVVCYENFSCLYFSNIMNAFRAWSDQEFKQSVQATPIEQKILSQEENDNLAREAAEVQYQYFLKRHELINPEKNREILAKDGLLNEGETVVDFYTRRATAGYNNIYVK